MPQYLPWLEAKQDANSVRVSKEGDNNNQSAELHTLASVKQQVGAASSILCNEERRLFLNFRVNWKWFYIKFPYIHGIKGALCLCMYSVDSHLSMITINAWIEELLWDHLVVSNPGVTSNTGDLINTTSCSLHTAASTQLLFLSILILILISELVNIINLASTEVTTM